jgi:hypothetical protein
MHRRALALFTLVVLSTVALGACGGKGGPSISDPKEIVTKAVEALQNARTAHIEATVEGTLKSGILGGGPSGDITLGGTTLSADIDFASKATCVRCMTSWNR